MVGRGGGGGGGGEGGKEVDVWEEEWVGRERCTRCRWDGIELKIIF